MNSSETWKYPSSLNDIMDVNLLLTTSVLASIRTRTLKGCPKHSGSQKKKNDSRQEPCGGPQSVSMIYDRSMFPYKAKLTSNFHFGMGHQKIFRDELVLE